MTNLVTGSWAVSALGVASGLGLTVLIVAIAPGTGVSLTPSMRSTTGGRPTALRSTIDMGALALAAVVGVACALATRWPVAGPIGALAAYGLPRMLRQMSGASSIAKIEAVATWTEMLRSTMAASAGLSQAIIATAGLSPDPIRPATEQLAAQIRAGVHPREALLQFADEVADPCADRVVCSLLLAFSSRAQRLGDLLHALADSTREEVALRLRIETSRASVRSGVRTVVVFSVLFAAALSVIARSYLAPFNSTTGQLVLLVVGGLYAGGLTLMVALARPPAAVRLLGADVVVR